MTFPALTSYRELSPCCSVWQALLVEIPVSSVTLFLAIPRVPLNCMNTKPLWICHLSLFYLVLQTVSSHKATQWLQTVLSQVFLSVAFLQKLKEWSQCYQKLFSTGHKPFISFVESHFSSCHHLGKPPCPISHP